MADRKQTLALHQHWQSHLDKWRDSGLNQAEYCRQNSLKPHQFGYWKKKFSQKNLPIEFVQIPEEAITSISTPGNLDSTLRLTVRSGFTIDIPDNFVPDTLEKLLGVLGRC
jgi:hypothetical protein